MKKGIWMEKSPAHVDIGDATLSNTARIGPKRSYQWFVDTSESEIFSNKKQVLPSVRTKLSSGMSCSGSPRWENPSSLQAVPNQFMNQLFGTESALPASFADRNVSSLGRDDLSGRRKDTDNQFGEGVPVSSSMSHDIVDAETRVSYAGIEKGKDNEVKDCDNGINVPREHGSNNSDLTTDQAFNRDNEISFVSMDQTYNREHDGMMPMGHTYNSDDAHTRPSVLNYGGGDDNTISIGDTFSKGDTNIISFGGFPDEQVIIPVGRPVSNYDQFYHQSLVTSETACEKAFEGSNATTVLNHHHVVNPKTDSVAKNKSECKPSRKEAPNSFPSNVRSLISTGMLDGVPVKYVSLARQELRGIIKGSGYLCGCQTCNYTKVLNAYEFERHAGCKTKHPNNHIYFENGKTIYQIVQELRSTPESLLFDAIQTVFGAPINQKSFRIWKESFQAATRELQRIYGKEEMNL